MTGSSIPPELRDITRLEWRELGFHYHLDARARCWHLLGSRRGLQHFGQLLSAHVDAVEPQQLGPYLAFRIGVAATPAITAEGLSGPLPGLRKLGAAVMDKIPRLTPGEVLSLRATFAPDCGFELQLEVQDDAFDPAAADAACRDDN